MTDRAGNPCEVCGKRTRFGQTPYAHEEGDSIVLVLHDADGGAAHPALPRYDLEEFVRKIERKQLQGRR